MSVLGIMEPRSYRASEDPSSWSGHGPLQVPLCEFWTLVRGAAVSWDWNPVAQVSVRIRCAVLAKKTHGEASFWVTGFGVGGINKKEVGGKN